MRITGALVTVSGLITMACRILKRLLITRVLLDLDLR